jgi:hypothetical protein
MEPRNRFQGINSASLCSLAGRYDNPIPTKFLAPIDCLKIPALVHNPCLQYDRISQLCIFIPITLISAFTIVGLSELLNKQRLEIQFSFQRGGGGWGEGGPTNSLKEEDSLHFSSFSVSLGYSKESAEGAGDFIPENYCESCRTLSF